MAFVAGDRTGEGGRRVQVFAGVGQVDDLVCMGQMGAEVRARLRRGADQG